MILGIQGKNKILFGYYLYQYIYISIYIYIYIIYRFIYTLKCRVSTEIHLWFDVWVPLAALSATFWGSIYSLVENRCSILKQN